MSRTDDEIRADLVAYRRWSSFGPFDADPPQPGDSSSLPRLLADIPALVAERDAALAVIAKVAAWRDELAHSRGGYDPDIAAKLTELLAPAAAVPTEETP